MSKILSKQIQKLVGKLKGDDQYHFEAEIPLRNLITIMYVRGWQFFRGFFRRFFFKNHSGSIFIGKRVKIIHRNLFETGRSCILENDVIIDCLSEKGVSLGNNVTIAKQSILQCTGVISNLGVGIIIGANSAVGAQSYLGGQGGIKIGENVIMGPGVKIFSENHNYSNPNIPIRLQGENRKGVTIKDNCWIGAGAILVDGVTIESGCVVAAGSVVTKNVNKDTIVGGIPAKKIGERCEA